MPSLAKQRESTEVIELEFAALYREHFAFVWRILGRFGIPEVSREDVAQEVFVVVHRRWDTWKREGTVRGWLYGVARRVAAQQRRSGERAKRRERQLPPAAAPPAIDDELARTRAKHALIQAIDALEPDRREVFLLADVDELSAPEIAAALGLKLNTVYSRLRLARRDILLGSREHQPERSPAVIPMLSLESTTQSLLADLRADQNPSEAVTERVWAGVREQLAGPGPSGGEGGPESSGGASAGSGATSLFVAKVVGATLSLTAAGLLAVKLGVTALQTTAASAPEAAELAAVQPPTNPALDTPPREASIVLTPLERDPERDPALDPMALPRPRAPQPNPADDADGVEAEVALLQAARAAPTPARTLELAAAHESRFPDGELAAERALIQIEAACALGHTEDARAWADRFARRHPHSPLQARVAASCAG